MKFFTAILAAMAASSVAGDHRVLHSTDNPKLMFFSASETADIDTYAKAEAFCQDKGRIVASQKEWCAYAASANGYVDLGSVPIRSGDYINVEKVCAESCPSEDKNAIAATDAPEDKTAIAATDAPKTSAPVITRTRARVTKAPANCKGAWDQCGGVGYKGATCCQPGFSCKGDSKWWSACKPGRRQLELSEPAHNNILCTTLPKAPPLPQTCAITFDDPHMETFDGLKYDCQGDGDYVLSKSLDSDFELQARFFKQGDWPGTTATAAVLTTGFPGEPKVEISYASESSSRLQYHLDGVEIKLDGDWASEGTLATQNDKAHFFRSGKDRYFVFSDSGISFHITKRYHPMFGNFMNIKLCLPDEMIESQRIVGLFGSPDGSTKNDFMNRFGTDLETVGKLYWGQIHDYCTSTWCIGSQTDSLFMNPGSTAHCDAPYDDALERAVGKADPELIEACGDNLSCLIDGIVGGIDAGKETAQDEKDLEGEEVIPDETPEDSDQEGCDTEDRTGPDCTDGMRKNTCSSNRDCSDDAATLPEGAIERWDVKGNLNCVDLGFDFGFKTGDPGCFQEDKSPFEADGNSLQPTKSQCDGEECSMPSANAWYSVTCSGPDGNQFKEATVASNVDMYIYVKAQSSYLYEYRAGTRLDLVTPGNKAISHIEFCFVETCPGSAKEAVFAPTSSPTAQTGSPTGSPTKSPAACPTDMPGFGVECNFEGNCEYGEETCCDGTTHSSIVMQCFDGMTTGYHTDACMTVTCERPILCTSDAYECPDGTIVGRTGPDCEFVCPKAPTADPTESSTQPPENKVAPTDPPKKGSGSGDPHFKTWTGDKYDYHGECDLVLVDNPSFGNGKGLRLHIRTTRVKFFSFIEKVALQIGEEVLEFDNDVENFLINGAHAEANKKHHKTMLAGYVVRRDKKAISVRLSNQKTGGPKIDFHTRKNGFPAVIVDGGHTDIFEGSLGLLGEWSTGKKIARDGVTEIAIDGDDATAFALEWQVNDMEPMLFKESRFPQYPTTCTPPAKMAGNRLGASSIRNEAEEACAHWKEDMEDCIFDVMATRDVLVAEEGHIVHVE